MLFARVSVSSSRACVSSPAPSAYDRGVQPSGATRSGKRSGHTRRRSSSSVCVCVCSGALLLLLLLRLPNSLGPPSRRRGRAGWGEAYADAPLMLRHWDDTFSNVFSGRPGTSVPIFVSMDHANYAGRLMNPLSMAMDVHVCQACRRDRRPGLHIARVGSRLAQHQEQARAGLPRRGPHQLRCLQQIHGRQPL